MLGDRPISLADSTTYVSHQDPAIDWERIIDRELERDEELRTEIDERVRKVAAKDPSIDQALERKRMAGEAFGLRTANRILRNPSLTVEEYLPRDGQKLTRFKIGVIPPSDLARIHDDCRAFSENVKREELHWRCFLHALRGIEDFGRDGKIPTRTVESVDYIDPIWLKDTFVQRLRPIADEVGRVAWMWNHFGDDDAKK